MTHTPIDIEALEALEAAATPAHLWRKHPEDPRRECLMVGEHGSNLAYQQNRDLVLALRNAAPELIKAVKERDALASALEQANHVIAINGLNETTCLTEIARLEATLASLRALLAEAGDVLKPFSYISKQWPAWISGDHHVQGGPNPTVGDLRRAASTLASIQSALRDASPTTGKPV